MSMSPISQSQSQSQAQLNTKPKKILVVGASGTVASEVVRELRAQGHSVRGTTSKASSGPDSVTVNLLTGEGLDAAFDGVDRAFFLSPGGYADAYRIFAPLIAKAKEAGLKKVVLMTAIGVEQNAEAPMRRAELDLERSGVPYNIIRPSWFMQNFNTFWVHGIKASGQIRLPVADGKASFIDARDISAVAAKLLVDDSFNNLAFTLTGPEPLTHAQVAALIGQAAGKAISFVDIEPEELKQGLLAGGVPADYTDLLLLLLSFLKAGYVETRNNSVLEILGRPPRDFKSYARDHAADWK